MLMFFRLPNMLATTLVGLVGLVVTHSSSSTAAAAPTAPSKFIPTSMPNMNGEYVFSATPGGTPGLFPTNFKDYPGGVEYFDWVSKPMTTRYSQVWWKPLTPTPLPKEMVDKYANSSVAIVGWEIDQIFYDADGQEHSLPINANYNHHYVAQLVGGSTTFKKIKLSGEDDPHLPELRKHSHGMVNMEQEHYIAELGTNGSSRFVSSGNGGEYRKTFHGFVSAILVY
jgi:hypothetical protein